MRPPRPWSICLKAPPGWLRLYSPSFLSKPSSRSTTTVQPFLHCRIVFVPLVSVFTTFGLMALIWTSVPTLCTEMSHLLFWPTITYFYPVGNTSAVCLTEGLPPESKADLLLLACGDPRHILYTVYTNEANLTRMYHFTR